MRESYLRLLRALQSIVPRTYHSARLRFRGLMDRTVPYNKWVHEVLGTLLFPVTQTHSKRLRVSDPKSRLQVGFSGLRSQLVGSRSFATVEAVKAQLSIFATPSPSPSTPVSSLFPTDSPSFPLPPVPSLSSPVRLSSAHGASPCWPLPRFAPQSWLMMWLQLGVETMQILLCSCAPRLPAGWMIWNSALPT